MKQIAQSVRSGKTLISETPEPAGGQRDLVVEVKASVISAGTERYVIDLASKSLIAKARARPDHVKRILAKIKSEGLRSTLTQVQAKLDEPMPLGYSAAGIVRDAGSSIRRFAPGDRVAVVAPHAAVVTVSENQCARIPEGVSFEQAAYTSIATIALQGVRNAKLTLGESALVIGTGLIGLITIALLRAQGCRVFGIDVDERWLELAREFGAEATASRPSKDAIRAFGQSGGVDAVIITAATDSNGPIELAADVARSKGRIVLVGVAGLNVPRPPFFEKELEFTVSSSLGPGRNDPAYESGSVNYPVGYARWTMQRNMEAVLDQMSSGRLPVDRLTTHRFDVASASKAYELLASRAEPYLGIALNYSETVRPSLPAASLPAAQTKGGIGTSMIGAGNFGRLVLLPLLKKRTDVTLRTVCTSSGFTAAAVKERIGFHAATSSVAELLADVDTDAVMVVTRHNSHAEFVSATLRAGKHVFVEKPLCITAGQLSEISEAVAASPDRLLMVGFNRRFSPSFGILREHLAGVSPISVSYRFAVPEIPETSWVQDPAVGGGRIIGEACHAIDACIALTGSCVTRVFAECVGARSGINTPDDRVFITLRHQNGSVSSISYQAGGDPSGPKERIEAFGGGRTAVIEDWKLISLWSGGRLKRQNGSGNKGHSQELDAFFNACRSGGGWPIPWCELESGAWAAMAAVESLIRAEPIEREIAT